MNRKSYSEFQEDLLKFLKLYHEKLARPAESLLQKEITPLQFYALCIIKEEQPAMMEIAQKLKMPKQHVTKIVDKLEELKLVQRIRDEQDRRVVRVTMSEQAAEVFDHQVKEQLGILCGRVERLGEENAKKFITIVQDMNALLELLPPADSGDERRSS